jgi:hypothetical protein
MTYEEDTGTGQVVKIAVWIGCIGREFSILDDAGILWNERFLLPDAGANAWTLSLTLLWQACDLVRTDASALVYLYADGCPRSIM